MRFGFVNAHPNPRNADVGEFLILDFDPPMRNGLLKGEGRVVGKTDTRTNASLVAATMEIGARAEIIGGAAKALGRKTIDRARLADSVTPTRALFDYDEWAGWLVEIQ